MKPRTAKRKKNHVFHAVFFAATIFATPISAISADSFADIVRKTEPLTPDEQQKKFHLPPGFEIQLVASEPQIGKPMNMAWDAQGRLWITQSREYPFPVLPVEKGGRDKVMRLENFDANGKAQKITTFAEGLNIPIGLLPYKDGVIAFSIPKIHFFEDTDGDGRADKNEILLTGFGYQKDTHGLTSNFRRGYDGWVYADHGFNNDSEVTAKDGSVAKMNSGNCYRFLPDGSHVEQYSWGQVNPFGLMFDPFGDLWSSDCHSSPVYQLLRGGIYPSFGKPHDGLGFAPGICAHSHGSTAIAGMVFYAATNFPPEFRNNTFVGNVMTCRINRDSYIEHGSTRIAKEEPDFLTCDDPWFRPVDLQLGPDGAIYVADFYNRIIGHYEVPLDHPGRDRERGRIWRIVYTGNVSRDEREASEGKTKTSKPSRISQDTLSLPKNVNALIAELGNSNITRRMLAMNELSDRYDSEIRQKLRNALSAALKKSARKNVSEQDDFLVVHALWILHRHDDLDDPTLVSAAEKLGDIVRIHALRIVSDRGFQRKIDPRKGNLLLPLSLTNFVSASITNKNPFVRRSAAETLGVWNDEKNLGLLLAARQNCDPEDSQLIYTIRMAMRNRLAEDSSILKAASHFSEADSRAIADVAMGIKTPDAGEFLLQHIEKFSESREKLGDYLRHAARYAPEDRMADLAKFTRTKFADDLDFQLALFKSVQEGTQQRGAKMDAVVADWGTELAEKLLASVDVNSLDWHNVPIKGNNPMNPWVLQERPSADGKTAQVISSFSPGGESYTGILKSKPFVIPAKLNFYLCGHDGTPDRPPVKKNFVRLRSAEDNRLLMEVAPPRNDTAQLVSWNLKKFAGKKGILEIVDGNRGHVYAWLGIGRFDPEIVPMPKIIPNQVDKRQLSAAELAETLRLKKLEPQLVALLKNENVDLETRSASAKALSAISAKTHLQNFAEILGNAEEPMKLRQQCAQALAQMNSEEGRAVLIEKAASAPQNLQSQIAVALSGTVDGSGALLSAVESGKMPARLLLENAVKDRLFAAKPENVNARFEQLTKNLTPLSVEKQKLIDARVAAFHATEPSAKKGAEVFTKNCAICHKLDDKGALVGPQLDGVGNRGADRIIEDILDPSRNVDAAFRYSNVTLKDDQVVSGLFRREEGELLIFADATGKEISVPKNQIAERRESENSLMPDNFSDLISGQDFNDLIAFLTAKRGKQN